MQDVEDPPSTFNITYHNGIIPTPVYDYGHWVFPNMAFGCTANLSKIIVRANASEEPIPRLTIWKKSENKIVDPNIIAEYLDTNISPNRNMSLESAIEYIFDPPVEVTDNYFVGLLFDMSPQLNRPIAFFDLGPGNAPVSVQVLASFSSQIIEVKQVADFARQHSRFFPLIAAEFGKHLIVFCLLYFSYISLQLKRLLQLHYLLQLLLP